ncbi:MAG: ABC transporter permease subunit [Candidatus Omnitrophota bacterium]|nr:ABC transporter permease subunit [Candidatus Omnitrophota bacterium]
MRNAIILAGSVIKELVRRKDFYLIFALLLVIIFYAAGISFGGEKGFERYFREVGISFAYIFSVIIAVVFASRQIPQEIETKTIYPILAHPVSRGEFILGKFLGALSISVISWTLFYGTIIAAFFLRGDFLSPPAPHAVSWAGPALLLEGYILHICLLSFFVSLSILLSLYLSAAANVGISLIVYFATNWFGAGLPAYIFLPHPELFDIKEKIIHTWDAVPSWAFFFLIIYACVYTGIFILASYAGFKRRNL